MFYVRFLFFFFVLNYFNIRIRMLKFFFLNQNKWKNATHNAILVQTISVDTRHMMFHMMSNDARLCVSVVMWMGRQTAKTASPPNHVPNQTLCAHEWIICIFIYLYIYIYIIYYICVCVKTSQWGDCCLLVCFVMNTWCTRIDYLVIKYIYISSKWTYEMLIC